MIIVDDQKKGPGLLSPSESSPGTSAGPSSSALQDTQPPTFEEHTRDPALIVNDFSDSDVFIPPGGEEPPPEFAPYEAEYFETGEGTIVSHDPHLNEDGEALYRFLLAHAQEPPQLLLHLHGDHTEYRTRQVQKTDANGRTRWTTESESYTVIDFDFHVDISPHVAHASPVHFTIPDNEPAYRGKMYMEVDAPAGVVGSPASAGADVELGGAGEQRVRRKARRRERKSAKAWDHERETRGLPPWVGPETGWSMIRPVDALVHQTSVLKSSKTVRQWADEYCASRKLLKEFTYQKVIYGWNLSALQAAITAAVQSTFYNGNLTVNFVRRSRAIHVRADNWLSRTLSNGWLKLLLWITLIYPFIWLFKRFASDGGGKWAVCGGAYALKSWQFVAPAVPSSSDAPPSYSGAAGEPPIVQTDKGAARLVGVREGEWFSQWEGTIKRAVSGRLQSRVPLVRPDNGPTTAALLLDGYVPGRDSF